jgi:hypothetical protein
MHKFFWVGASARCEDARAHPDWAREFWPNLACPECDTLLAQEVARPIDIVIADDADMSKFGPTGSTELPYCVDIIERALAEHLGLSVPDFALGTVTQGGRVIESHYTWTCAAHLRIPQWSDGCTKYSHCATCGRRFDHTRWGEEWVKSSDVQDVSVFASCSGGGPYVIDDMWYAKDLANWKDIQTKEIEIR